MPGPRVAALSGAMCGVPSPSSVRPRTERSVPEPDPPGSRCTIAIPSARPHHVGERLREAPGIVSRRTPRLRDRGQHELGTALADR